MDASTQTAPSYRWARPEDFDTLGKIMFAAIHAEPSPYTPAQRIAWCPVPPHGPGWTSKLLTQDTTVAVVNQKLVGFLTLDATGYLDLAFILPEARGQGHLARLFEMIKIQAGQGHIRKITTHASLAAQAPFAALGFHIVHHESVDRNGQTLQRAEMAYDLKITGRDTSIR